MVGINYAPEVTGIAPYTTGFAEGMARAGHDVSVVTALPHYPEWRIAAGYEDAHRAPTVINGVRVRRVKLHVPVNPTPRGRILLEASFAQAAVRAPWGRPDLVVAVSPTLLSTAVVIGRSRLLRVPCGVIVQDLYSSGVVETGAMSGRLATAAARFEGAVLSSATGVSLIHDRFVNNVVKLGVDRSAINVVRNWTHIEQRITHTSDDDVRAAFGWKRDEIVAIHTGNMGVKQGLENVVAAGKLEDRSNGDEMKVRFVLIGDGNQRKMLEQQARGLRQVDILDPVPEDQFRRVLGAADVLLVNEKPGVGEMAVPSKLTSYFVSGKPVVAATDPNSGTAHEIDVSGGGLRIPPGDPGALLAAVRNMGTDRQTAERLGAMGRRFATETLDAGTAVDRYEQWCRSLVERRR